jgi:hypothetical protein
MNPVVQVRNAGLHSFLILASYDSIHSRRSLSLQQVEAVQQPSLVHMMQQRCEP